MGSLDMQVEVYFHLPLASNSDEATKILYEVAATSRFILLNKGVVVNALEAMTETQPLIKYTVKAYVIDTRYESAFKSDVTSRANRLLSEHKLR
jgi:hypothetical protein